MLQTLLIETNPLDWYNVRSLNTIPSHFVKVKFNSKKSTADTLDWLNTNTRGRYAVCKDESNSIQSNFLISEESLIIGFEDPAEATMYSMFFT